MNKDSRPRVVLRGLEGIASFSALGLPRNGWVNPGCLSARGRWRKLGCVGVDMAGPAGCQCE